MDTDGRLGDTKAGKLVGVDKFGNKFFEDPEELPRTSKQPAPPKYS